MGAVAKVAVSILTGLVTFTHNPKLHIEVVEEALEDAGFEIASAKDSHDHSLFGHSEWKWTRALLERLAPPKQKQKKKKHRETCRACIAEKEGLAQSIKSPEESSIPRGKQPPVLLKTRVVVGGMTCASCVNSLKSALVTAPGVQRADVSLLPASATVVHDTSILPIDKICDIVSEAGYKAELSGSTHLDLEVKTEQPSQESFKATLAIEGMTCAACVSSVSDAIKSVDGVQNFSIDLLGASGTLFLARQDVIEKVTEAIEDSGFEVDVLDVSSNTTTTKGKATQAEKQRRKVRIRIDGLFCHVCLQKVNTCLSTLPFIENFTTITSTDNPVTSIEYFPNPPEETLRTIQAAITNLGGFQMSLLQEPSLSERAERAQRKERDRILLRFLITFLFAIPTFTVGVVAMNILPHNSLLRLNMHEAIVGNASRGTFIMMALATPIQFGVGQFFYVRAWKSLRGVWRRKATKSNWKRVWRDRLLRWGSMDTLVSLGTSIGYFSSLVYLILDARSITQTENDYFDVSVFLIVSHLTSNTQHTLTYSTALHSSWSIFGKFKQVENRRRFKRTGKHKALSRSALHTC